MSSWGSGPASPVSGTVITVAFWDANAKPLMNILRALTGGADPPGSNYVVLSIDANTTYWGKIPADALAAGVALSNLLPGTLTDDKLVNQKVSRVGDSMSGNLTFPAIGVGVIFGGGGNIRDEVGSTSLYANANTLTVATESGSAAMLTVTPSGAIVNGFTAWHAGNDHNHPAGFTFANGGKIRDNVTGTILSANADVFNVNNEADSATMLAVTPAAFNWMGNVVYHAGNIASATAGDASALGGLGPTSYARLAAASNFTTPPTINGATIIHTGNILAQSVAFASTAGNAATADTAGQLGGVAAASYARKDAASNFTVAPTIGGNAIVHAATTGWAGQSGDSLALGGVAASGWAKLGVLSNFTVSPTINGNAIITQANIGAQSVATASLAGDSLALGGVSASGYPRRAAGNYTGNNTAGRQIATGFVATQVMIQSDGAAFTFISLNTARALAVSASSNAATTGVHLHATDGFVVGANANEANGSADTYHWVALG